MTVTVKIYSTKPPTTQFYNQFDKDADNKVWQLNDWTASQPGFVKQGTVVTGQHERLYTVVWETVEDYANWLDLRNTQPVFLERTNYNIQNEITTRIEESIT